jgi:hypothetical protein
MEARLERAVTVSSAKWYLGRRLKEMEWGCKHRTRFEGQDKNMTMQA